MRRAYNGGLISGDHYKKWVKANRKRLHAYAVLLREAADHLDNDGLPIVENKAPGWGTVILMTDKTGSHPGHLKLEGSLVRGAEAALEACSDHITVVMGKKAVTNCRAVVVVPARGKTVRVRAEPKDG